MVMFFNIPFDETQLFPMSITESSTSDEECLDAVDHVLCYTDKYVSVKRSRSEAQNTLLSLIRDVKTCGLFAISGSCHVFPSLTNIGLFVEDKPWAFPMTQVPECTLLQQAPFGHGQKTVIDETIDLYRTKVTVISSKPIKTYVVPTVV